MRHNAGNSEADIVHKPVLWQEILGYVENSIYKGEGTMVDCTLGEGGHSKLLLENFKNLRIIAIDRDSAILDIAEKRLEPFGNRIKFINSNYSEIDEVLGDDKGKINYMLFDFGISSYHLEKSSRGFAFKEDQALDMRLDRSQKLDAKQVVNYYKEKRLSQIIYEYGEERWSRKIASEICKQRKGITINTTGELAGIVLGAIPKKFHVKNIHPATRVFQAIRIEVNGELEGITKGLGAAHKFLVSGGRVMAISFHSLEDRIVKNIFKKLKTGCTCDLDPRFCICDKEPLVKLLTKKPVKPGNDEIALNKRSRSSKLRVYEKI